MIRHTALIACLGVLGLAALTPTPSEARVFVGVGVGGCCAYGPGWDPYYPAYGYAPYPPYAPPPIVYAAPPVQPYYAPASMLADQTSPTFVDSYGRTCRRFQATGAMPAGTACEMADGSWRVVQ